jgi:uncharacterized protein (TIGR02145 family)
VTSDGSEAEATTDSDEEGSDGPGDGDAESSADASATNGDGDGDGDGDADLFVDPRDGENYDLLELGGAKWFGQNLRYATAMSRCYDDDPANCETYGRLYLYSEALTACPTGFHLSSDADWHALEMWMGMSTADLEVNGYSAVRGSDEGARLRVGGDVGFDAPMAGFATGQGFSALGDRTYIWTSTDVGASNVFRRRIEMGTPTLWRFTNPTQDYEISVRCVQD